MVPEQDNKAKNTILGCSEARINTFKISEKASIY